MDIRNATQFANFISKGGLQNLDMTFQQVIFCINNYNAACSCWKAEAKKALYDSCTVTYMNAVRNIVPKFKNEFLSKTEERQIQFFTDNGALIGIVCR